MQYFSFFFEGLLILIVIGFIIRNISLEKKVSKLKMEKWHQEAYYQTLLHQNEVLKSYMDDRHMVWNIELTPSALATMQDRVSMVVLMNGQEALEIWDGRYEMGYQAGRNSAGFVNGPVPRPRPKREGDTSNVVKLNAALSDKRYDGDYREHVNELTNIAVRFAGTQQLRSRLASQVFNFREYLKKRENGQTATFPKEN
jgi:hypothetical protein